MDSKAIAGKIAEQDWLEPLADTVQSAIASAFESAGDSGKQIKDMLHGTWLGHPLHPVLTDVPIGAWTTAVALDMLDSVRKDDALRAGAEAAIGLGIVGAVGAAITGLADWHVLGEEEPKRVGMAHSLVNTAATVLFATSLALRKRKSYTAGKFTALAGLATLSAGAYLGGVLVYEDELGVDHSPQESAADKWTSVMNESELRE